MIGSIIGGVASSIVGGLLGGISANRAAQKKANALQSAATEQKRLAEELTGEAAYNKMMDSALAAQNAGYQFQSGQNTATDISDDSTLASQKPLSIQPSTNYFDSGAQQKATEMAGQYAKGQQDIQNQLKQAEVDWNADNAKYQAGMNAAGGLVDLGKNIVSDEDTKEHNDSEPPQEATVEDALRNVNSIIYKYKDEWKDKYGLDDDFHVGVTAQSLEDGAFDDTVAENTDGMKMLDKDKLLESVMAGIACLQKEIDRLKEV